MKNGLSVAQFFDEFTDFMDNELLLAQSDFVLVGDFNFHMEENSDSNAKRFRGLISSSGLTQHVKEVTHDRGHLLDLVITQSDSQDVKSVGVIETTFSDHKAIHFRLDVDKPARIRSPVTSRKLRSLDTSALSEDIRGSSLVQNPPDDLAGLVNCYNDLLTSLLDKHAPEKTRTFTLYPDSPWFTDAIQDARRKRRKLERRYHRTKCIDDKLMYRAQQRIVDAMIDEAKHDHYNGLITAAKGNQKELFHIINKLLNVSGQSTLPLHNSSTDLANRFAEHFITKIKTIRDGLEAQQDGIEVDEGSSPVFDGTSLTSFAPADEEEVRRIIMQSPCKSCPLDPIPTRILKECIDELLPTITRIVNLSILDGSVPTALKEAPVTPLLKKANLPPDFLKNYRPVSGLPFISKIVEKVVASRETTWPTII